VFSVVVEFETEQETEAFLREAEERCEITSAIYEESFSVSKAWRLS
jgi:hypothetical protein